jgi:hypothetical protein
MACVFFPLRGVFPRFRDGGDFRGDFRGVMQWIVAFEGANRVCIAGTGGRCAGSNLPEPNRGPSQSRF